MVLQFDVGINDNSWKIPPREQEISQVVGVLLAGRKGQYTQVYRCICGYVDVLI